MSAYTWITESIRRTPGVLSPTISALRLRQATVFLTASIVCAVVLLAGRLDQGWWHHDDGSFAHSAERVLAGELPHRDFADLYTGLLTFVNGAMFALLGENMFNLRIPLALTFVVFVGCFFALARRLVSPPWAFVATLFAIAWSLPVYPAPMPSWYTLFLTTIGMYAVVRYLETRRRRWLFAAGLCGGASIAIKVVGVWYVLAVLIALLCRPLVEKAKVQSPQPRSRVHTATVAASAIVALGLAIAVFSGRPAASEVVGLLIPFAVLCASVVVLGLRKGTVVPVGATRAVLIEQSVFLAGVALPLTALALPYVLSGSLGDLVNGVLISPQSRYEFSSYAGPDPATLLRALPVVLIFVLRSRLPQRGRLFVDVAASMAMIFVVATAAVQPSYSIVWGTTRALAPFVILLGAFAILRRGDGDPRNAVVVLIVLIAGFSTLTQFPFATPVYFAYVVPLVLLAAIACMRRLGETRGLLPAIVLCALVVFGIRQLDTQSIWSLGVEYKRDTQTATLDEDRASIRILPSFKAKYDRVRQVVAHHRVGSDVIFAGPDAPEIYFLTQSRNPTPSIMDFLDSSKSTRGARLTALLEREEVPVVVLNRRPEQSPRLDAAAVRRIRVLYPGAEVVDKFEIRWREDDSIN